MKNNTNQCFFTLSAIMLALSSHSYANTFIINNGEQAVIDNPFTSNAENVAGANGDAVRVMLNSSLTMNDSASLTSFGDNAKGLSVYADAAVIFNGDTDITTNGNSSSHALQLLQNGSVLFNGENNIITVNGAQSYGLFATSVGADILVKNSIKVNTNGNLSIAVAAQNGANINLGTGSKITTGTGDNAYAIYANGTNAISKITAKNIDIETSGLSSHAVYAANGGGQIFLSGENNNVVTNGERAYGLIASRPNSSIIIDGAINVITNGERANGVTATNTISDVNGVYVNLGSNSSITTNNYHSNGLVSVNDNAVIDANNIIISTFGDESHGILTDNFGTSNLIGNNIVTTTGENANGIMATRNGVINANNTQIITSGMNSDAVFSSTQSVINLNQKNANLHSINGYSFNALGGEITANLDGSNVLNNGVLINADTDGVNYGVVNVTADNIESLTGDIQASTGSNANITLMNTHWTGLARNGGLVNIDKNSIWNIAASSDVAELNNSGTINLSNPIAGDLLVVHGNYIGNNGHLIFNTELNNDDSVTDKMIVEGNTSGNTSVSVINAGGSGATTLNGIELIQVNGLSDGEFVQNGRIVAGAYDYRLLRGVGQNAANWYLSNQISLPVDPENPVASGEEIKRPEAGSYTANLASANNMFVTRLHDRLGETQYIDVLTGEQKVTSMWLRNEGGHNRSRDTSGQLKTQSNRYVMQLGGDIAQWSNDGLNRLHLGVMAGYGNSKSDTNAKSGYKSGGSVDGYSTGVYSTWYANDEDKSGLYVDGWAQYSWFNNTVQGEGLATEEYKSKGVTASVESGYTFKVGENKSKNETYFIQPKAQITWMGVKANDHTEANGTHVNGQGDGNIQTRLGLRSYMKGHHESDNGKDREFQPFVEANWIHNTKDFGTNMNAVEVKQAGAKNIGELKVGVEGQLNKQLNVWGNVGQQLGDKGYSDTAVMLGVKYNF